MEKFVNVGSISKDHIDPSIFCVLTAKSKQVNVPLADFLIFSPRWDISTGTFRPPVSFAATLKSFLSDQIHSITTEIQGRSLCVCCIAFMVVETGFCPHGGRWKFVYPPLHYSTATGSLVWRVQEGDRGRAEVDAGSWRDDYKKIFS